MHKKQWIWGISLCVLAAMALSLFFFSQDTVTAPIRLGTNPWPGYEFLHLADKKGFFKEEGVNVKLIRFSALEDTRRALERGQIDGMASTLIELLQAYENGHAQKIILMTDFSNGSDLIIARKGIRNITDLKGKKIGVESASLGVFILARALEQAKLSLNDVHLIDMPPLNIEKQLLSNEIDAVHAYPPYSTNILKHTNQVTKIFDSTQIPGEVVDILSISADIAEHNMNALLAIRRAWDKSVAYARQHPEEAHKIMAEIEEISPQEFTEALQGVKVLNIEDQKPLMARGGTIDKTIKMIAEILHKGGYLKNAAINPEDYMLHWEDSAP